MMQDGSQLIYIYTHTPAGDDPIHRWHFEKHLLTGPILFSSLFPTTSYPHMLHAPYKQLSLPYSVFTAF